MHFQGLIGVAVLMLFAYALSTDRRRINYRIVFAGLILQFITAFLFLKSGPVLRLFDGIGDAVAKVCSFADAGTAFIFNKVSDESGPWGFVFAVKVLPVIIFFASLMSVLYHLRIMQYVVAGFAWVLRATLGITGAEAVSSAANIFLGQTEAPLLVRPYIPTMTKSQLMSIMTGGFASIAGSVLAAYVGILGGTDEHTRALFAKHLVAASVMSAPATFVAAKLMLPETETPRDESLRALLADQRTTRNVVDAAAAGATDGLHLALNVAAMLVAFVALVAMLNWPLAALSDWAPVASWRDAHGLPIFKIESVLGLLFKPVAWMLGVSSEGTTLFGRLLGEQVIVTEFIAYADLGQMIKQGTMGSRDAQIATYALCGFCNLPSIAIQIGGLGGMAPTRRGDIATLGLRAMTAGAVSCWMAAAIAGCFIDATPASTP
jgi:CNT family concentrative nucleoside transporter